VASGNLNMALPRVLTHVLTVKSNSRNEICQMKPILKEKFIQIFCISGSFAVQINTDVPFYSMRFTAKISLSAQLVIPLLSVRYSEGTDCDFLFYFTKLCVWENPIAV
jgi:hypothetical protein